MRRKIGTRIDATLYQQVKDFARRQGRTVNDVIEEALTRYIAGGASRTSIVEQTRGLFRVSESAFRAVLKEDLI